METEKIPILLVAKQNIIPVLRLTIESLEKNIKNNIIHLVVPDKEINLFEKIITEKIKLIPESYVVPNWTHSRISDFMPKQPDRAGWYLQQFIKLNFGIYSKYSEYLIWDADTILLKPVKFKKNLKYIFNPAKEYHAHYFKTFERILGIKPTLSKSVISQFMMINTEICLEMQRDICRHGNNEDWIKIILCGLPFSDKSEFSEYETYGNYIAYKYPEKIELNGSKWFRYGSEICNDLTNLSLSNLETIFRAYSYVAFESHKKNMLRKLGSKIILKFGL
jgi:hypothetical protein